MSIKNMHFDFKMKLNKIDSQKYRNLRVQEIDWKLNEAYTLFVKAIAEPRVFNGLGVEIGTRTINDLRTLVLEKVTRTAIVFDNSSYTVALPENYWFMLSSQALGQKGTCIDVLDVNEVQHDDRVEESPMYKSSFEWRETNCRYHSGGLRLFTDKTFSIKEVYMDYIRTLEYIHFAQGVQGGSYTLPDGTTLTGFRDCPLPKGVHGEIVDLAVLITTGDLQIPDYQVKMAKVKLNE